VCPLRGTTNGVLCIEGLLGALENAGGMSETWLITAGICAGAAWVGAMILGGVPPEAAPLTPEGVPEPSNFPPPAVKFVLSILFGGWGGMAEACGPTVLIAFLAGLIGGPLGRWILSQQAS